jgi:hypothetical protein
MIAVVDGSATVVALAGLVCVARSIYWAVAKNDKIRAWQLADYGMASAGVSSALLVVVHTMQQ